VAVNTNDLLFEDACFHPPPCADNAFELSQYAAQTRYPGDWEPVTEADVGAAIALAERVLAWAEGQIGNPPL